MLLNNFHFFLEIERLPLVRGQRPRVVTCQGVAEVEVVNLHRQKLLGRHRFLPHRILPCRGLAHGGRPHPHG